MVLRTKNLNKEPRLTSREAEILELCAQGLSTEEVAQQLVIAPRTVARHVENIRLKLRARNKPHMVVCAVIAGLLDIDVSEKSPDPPF
jgi:LuxR family transcriptional regulator, transcriptional regulator of spore coat protein